MLFFSICCVKSMFHDNFFIFFDVSQFSNTRFCVKMFHVKHYLVFSDLIKKMFHVKHFFNNKKETSIKNP